MSCTAATCYPTILLRETWNPEILFGYLCEVLNFIHSREYKTTYFKIFSNKTVSLWPFRRFRQEIIGRLGKSPKYKSHSNTQIMGLKCMNEYWGWVSKFETFKQDPLTLVTLGTNTLEVTVFKNVCLS